MYATICCANLDDDDDLGSDSDESFESEETGVNVCFVEYLKSNRKVDEGIPTLASLPLACRLVMPQIFSHLRWSFSEEMKKVMPNDVDCVTKELNKNGSLDGFMAFVLVEGTNKFGQAEKETKLNELVEAMKPAATECGIGEDNFLAMVGQSSFRDKLRLHLGIYRT